VRAQELIELHDELEFLLQQRGPVQFIRDLILQSEGAQVLAHESRHLGDGRRSTRFLYCDTWGDEAFLTVISETDPQGQSRYALDCRPRLERTTAWA
jgi:hypothetical protein